MKFNTKAVLAIIAIVILLIFLFRPLWLKQKVVVLEKTSTTFSIRKSFGWPNWGWGGYGGRGAGGRGYSVWGHGGRGHGGRGHSGRGHGGRGHHHHPPPLKVDVRSATLDRSGWSTAASTTPAPARTRWWYRRLRTDQVVYRRLRSDRVVPNSRHCLVKVVPSSTQWSRLVLELVVVPSIMNPMGPEPGTIEPIKKKSP